VQRGRRGRSRRCRGRRVVVVESQSRSEAKLSLSPRALLGAPCCWCRRNRRSWGWFFRTPEWVNIEPPSVADSLRVCARTSPQAWQAEVDEFEDKVVKIFSFELSVVVVEFFVLSHIRAAWAVVVDSLTSCFYPTNTYTYVNARRIGHALDFFLDWLIAFTSS
jgi:hypothetical protein